MRIYEKIIHAVAHNNPTAAMEAVVQMRLWKFTPFLMAQYVEDLTEMKRSEWEILVARGESMKEPVPLVFRKEEDNA